METHQILSRIYEAQPWIQLIFAVFNSDVLSDAHLNSSTVICFQILELLLLYAWKLIPLTS